MAKRPVKSQPSVGDQAYAGMMGQTMDAVMTGRVPASDPALRNWDMLNTQSDMQPAQGGEPAPARRR